MDASQDLRRRENPRRVAIVIATESAEFRDLDTSMALGARLRELASEFNNQHRIVYEGTRPTAISRRSIQVRATRPDLRVRVTWMPAN
jgi:hypothetical protein